MSQTTGSSGGSSGASTGTPARPADTTRPTSATELISEQGRTTIADVVVAKIAGIAAREISGVHELLAHGAGGAIAGLAQRVTGSDPRGLGVRVEVGEKEAAIDLKMIVDYGVSIHQVAEAVRQNIINRVHAMTGLTVRQVNIDIDDLYFPEDTQPTQPARSVEPRVQ